MSLSQKNKTCSISCGKCTCSCLLRKTSSESDHAWNRRKKESIFMLFMTPQLHNISHSWLCVWKWILTGDTIYECNGLSILYIGFVTQLINLHWLLGGTIKNIFWDNTWQKSCNKDITICRQQPYLIFQTKGFIVSFIVSVTVVMSRFFNIPHFGISHTLLIIGRTNLP